MFKNNKATMEGAYGKLFVSRDGKVVVKKFGKDEKRENEEPLSADFLREAQLYLMLDNKSIGTPKARCIEENKIELERFKCDASEMPFLSDYTYPFATALLGLKHIHELGFIHLDIKPNNLLYDHRTGRLVVADFGMACPAILEARGNRVSEERSFKHPTLCLGCYCAPETANNDVSYKKSSSFGTVSTKSDIWSMACVFYEILCSSPLINTRSGQVVYKELALDILKSLPTECSTRYLSEKSRHKSVSRNNKSLSQKLNTRIGGTASKSLVDLLVSMLNTDPAERPTAAQCLESPYFDNIRDQIEEADLHFQSRKISASITSINVIDISTRRFFSKVISQASKVPMRAKFLAMSMMDRAIAKIGHQELECMSDLLKKEFAIAIILIACRFLYPVSVLEYRDLCKERASDRFGDIYTFIVMNTLESLVYAKTLYETSGSLYPIEDFLDSELMDGSTYRSLMETYIDNREMYVE